MRRSARGFTLIELMIVVAIIGILAAIAVPNFVKFTARARQSEVKSNLKGFATAAKSYFAENNTYACADCGFQVEPGNRYYYDFGGGAKVTRDAKFASDPYTCTPPASSQAATTFLATSAGNIDSDNTCDTWTIDQNNLLTQTVDDVNK